MKKTIFTIIFFISIIIYFTGCSTQKNKTINRFYHSLLTQYNIAFNGQMAYNEGLAAIDNSNKDNFSEIIKMYAVSNHENISSATSKMNRTIEKCRKAIKLHSIQKKPTKNYKRIREPKYKAFYYQNEFNPALKKVWLLLAKAEFHKGDFLNSIGTFKYIIHFYKTNPEVVTEAKIWIVRAYLEQGWVYEAENEVNKISQEKISNQLSGLYAGTMAQLFIQKKEYQKAIPFLKIAIDKEKKKKQKIRFEFVTAQLIEKIGNKQEATQYYSKVIKRNPSYKLEFNARLNRSQITNKSQKKVVRELKKLAKNSKNKKYLDQIYTAIGNVYYQSNDTAEAVKNYKLAIAKSTRNKTDKGVALIKLGDYYYNKKEYVKASPYYEEAATIYTKKFTDFERINYRSLVLNELVQEHNIVHLQDSLQHLATIPKKERLKAIQRVIDKLIEEEKQKEEKETEEQYASEDNFSMPMQPIGSSNNGAWYFYNPTTVSRGKTEFRKKWGKRKLEDNWRRVNKLIAFANNTAEVDTTNQTIVQGNSIDTVSMRTDSVKRDKIKKTTNKKDVNYYLAQIPFTAEQREKSNQQIADALFNMGFIYKEKIEDVEMTYRTFDTFKKRFGTDERVANTIFQKFLIASKTQDLIKAESYRNEILAHYAESKYANLLKDAQYISNRKKILEIQDSIYWTTYNAYTKNKFHFVFEKVKLMKEKYPYATLVPQFELLKTLSIGKTKSSREFEKSLNALLTNYPETEISTMAKDILALLKQGKIAQRGNTHGSLLAKRKKLLTTTKNGTDINQLENDKIGQHRLLMLTKATDKELNKLQYNLAIFNFSKFLIKNFGFEKRRIREHNSLSVTNLSSYEEAIWYHNTLMADSSIVALMDSLQMRSIAISENNFEKIQNLFSIEEYLTFEKDSLQKGIEKEKLYTTIFNIPKKTVKKEKVVIIDKATELFPQEKEVKTVEKTDTLLTNTQDSIKTTQKTDSIIQKTKVIEEKKSVAQQTVKKRVKRYKNLFVYEKEAPLYIVFYIPSAKKINTEQIKKVLEEFNKQNYQIMNLKVTSRQHTSCQAIVIGTFNTSEIGKSYLINMLRNNEVKAITKGINKRNLIITEENLNILLRKKENLKIYFEFMKKYYLDK